MTRALMIDPGGDPTWVDLDAAHINDSLHELLGPCDFDVIQRDTDRFGPGIQLAVYEYSLTNGAPHNTLASDIVAALGRSYHVHGRCVLMGLDGPDTVDLTVQRWELLLGHVARAATPQGA